MPGQSWAVKFLTGERWKMCGRYSVYESMDHYPRQLSLDLVVINGYFHSPISRYNVAPSTRVAVIRQVEGGPYYITSTDGGPLFFAALAEVQHSVEPDERDGFVIITAAADQGLVDIQDRKPLVLSPDIAREWVDPATTPERAAEILEIGCRPAQDFRWFPVDNAVGSVRNQGPELIEPVSEESRQGDFEF